jgi:hypothetical protein
MAQPPNLSLPAARTNRKQIAASKLAQTRRNWRSSSCLVNKERRRAAVGAVVRDGLPAPFDFARKFGRATCLFSGCAAELSSPGGDSPRGKEASASLWSATLADFYLFYRRFLLFFVLSS